MIALQWIHVLSASCFAAGLLTPEVLNVGSVTSGAVVTREIAFLNTSSTSAERLKVASSCECLEILSAPKRLDPGEAGVLSVRFRPKKEGGAIVDLLFVTDYNGQMAQSRVIWKANITGAPSHSDSVGEDSLIKATRAIKERGLVYIDLRNASRYREGHIAGSINLSLRELITQDSWKAQPIVLVDGDIPSMEVQRGVLTLRKMGFESVRYLEGGLLAWRDAGGRLNGTSVEDINKVSIDQATLMEKGDLLKIIFLTRKTDLQTFKQSLIGQMSDSSGKGILLVAEESGQYQRVKAELKAYSSLLFCDGTIADWVRYYAVQANHETSSLVIGAEEPRGSSTRSGPASKFCRTCP